MAVGYGANANAAEALAAELSSGGAIAEAFGADLEDPEAPARLAGQVE